MKLLYSDVPPLRIRPNVQVLVEYLYEQAKKADTVYCIVGYVSKNGLIKLDEIIKEAKIKHVILVLGMYCMEGFPESIYNTAISIDKSWKADNIGEIRATKSIKYHGKVYGFCKNGKLFSAAVGSHNLGAVSVEAGNRRQYELSIHTEAADECNEIKEHISSVITEPVSFPLSEIKGVTIYHEENTKLNGVEGVSKASVGDVESFKSAETKTCFNIPLKVPGIPGSTQDYMKSNINKCYAKGRLNTRSGVITERGWWETEIIVGTDITSIT